MYDNYLTAIYIALLVSPYLSMLAIIPYLRQQYKSKRLIIIDKSICYYLLVIFWLCAFFMTMLPFPDREAVKYMNNEIIQFIPFKAVYSYFTQSEFAGSDILSYLPSLKNWYFMSPLLNIMMLLPFGYLMRVVFDRNFKNTILEAFISSLFFEAVQLSGLFFIYIRPYRTFDVDDIITNVFGAVIGWVIAPKLHNYSIITKISNGAVVRQGGDVSLRRRIPAIIIDQVVSLLITILISLFIHLNPITGFPVVFLIFLIINCIYGFVIFKTNGTSLGYRITGLTLKSMVGNNLSFIQSLMRMILLAFTFSVPFWMGYLLYLSAYYGSFTRVLIVLLNTCISIIYMLMIFSFLLNGLTHGSTLFHDKICDTYLGLSEYAKKTDDLMLIMSNPLTAIRVSEFSDEIYKQLLSHGIDHKSALRVQLLADGAMNDWLGSGLAGNICELKYDSRLWHKTLFLSIFNPTHENTPGTMISQTAEDESYIAMLAGVRLSYEVYHTAVTNTIAIDIP